jgi:hypothetical protein
VRLLSLLISESRSATEAIAQLPTITIVQGENLYTHAFINVFYKDHQIHFEIFINVVIHCNKKKPKKLILSLASGLQETNDPKRK